MVSRIKTYFQRFKSAVLPTFNLQVLALIIAGVFCGLLAYLVYMSKAYSYLSDNPEVCINCHVMGPYYATWQHSSHKNVATCNDCHVPHKYFCQILLQGYRRTQTLIRLHYA